MPDVPASAAGVTATHVAPPQPTEFKVPDGKHMLDVAEYETLRRNNERVRGLEGYYQAGGKIGIKSPQDFDRWARLNETAQKSGVDLDMLVEALANPGRNDEPKPVTTADLEGNYLTKADIAKMLDEREHGVLAKTAHERAVESEKGLLDKSLRDLFGTEYNDWERDAALYRIEQKRGLYPDSHPLHKDHLRPFDEPTLKPLLDAIKAERQKLKGGDLKAQGDAAAAGKITTPAGSSGTRPQTPTPRPGDERRPGGLPSKASVESEHVKRQAARGQKPVSSMGG